MTRTLILYVKGERIKTKAGEITRFYYIGEAGKHGPQKQRHVKCRCECGTIKSVQLGAIRAGHTFSCGCWNSEVAKKHLTGQTHSKTHGLQKTRLYRVWIDIKSRCLNSNHKGYYLYGGRGITIHEEWIDDYAAFYAYVSALPSYPAWLESKNVKKIVNLWRLIGSTQRQATYPEIFDLSPRERINIIAEMSR